MLRVEDLDYELPEELIARRPCEPRDASRLLVVSRSEPGVLEHARFADLPRFLRDGDLLVRNRSSVIPARLLGRRTDTGGRVEGLFLDEPEPGVWRAMLKSNGRLRKGTAVGLCARAGGDSAHTIHLHEKDGAVWTCRYEGPAPSARDALAETGTTPLPPYILQSRKRDAEHTPDDLDRSWYQTVYADPASAGSVAAPTAGLHFTPEVLQRLDDHGVASADVILHVGPGTFQPIEAERLDEHRMHEERYLVPRETIRALHDQRRSDGRIVAVGTTSVRAIESLPPDPDPDADFSASTDLFIRPGHEFRFTEALVTNFHLPRSTLLALVAALFPEGIPRLLEVYREAIRERYRFYSYGDAMLILP